MKNIPTQFCADSISCPQVLCSVAQLSSKHPAFTENSVRSMIYASKPRKRSASKNGLADLPGNGLAHAIIKLGRRVLIDEQAFLQWVNSHSVDLGSHSIPIVATANVFVREGVCHQ